MKTALSKKGLTLRQMLGITYLLGTVLLAVVTTLLVRDQLSVRFREDLLSHGRLVAEQLAKDSRIALIQRAAENVQASVAMAGHFPNVEAVAIYTAEGQRLIGSAPPRVTPAVNFSQEAAQLIEEDFHHLLIAAPVRITTDPPEAENPFGTGPGEGQQTLLGFVTIAVSKAAMQAAVQAMERQLLGSIILVATVVFTLMMLLIHWITHPLKQLARVMTDPETPQRYTRAVVSGTQEAVEIASSFNALMTAFARVNEELIHSNEALESRVEERTQALRQANQALQEASEVKSKFLSKMSHELRTPLQAMMTGADLLLTTGPLRPEQLQWTQIIYVSAYLLLDLVNDVLDVSRLEAGKLALEIKDFDLHRVLHEVILVLSLQAAEKGLRLDLHVTPNTPYQLRGDHTRLSQILLNLVGNAVKFTHQGYVKLKVAALKEAELWVNVRFEVVDTGIGIPVEAQDRIFEDFTQADESVARHYGGTGLGITITKRLVELMGGRLDLHSEVGKGSCFRFELPFQKSPPAAPAPAEEILTGLQVLMVSADTQTSTAWRQLLQPWGVNSRLEPDREHALQAFRHAPPWPPPFTTVLVDERGVQPSAEAFAHDFLQGNPGISASLILIRATPASDPGDAYLEAGYTAVLSPPVDKDQLYRTLRLTREMAHRQTGALRAAGVVRSPARSLQILLAEDNPTTRVMLEQWLQAAGHRPYLVGNGRQALAMLETHPFDLAIIDLQMPVLDGHEVITRYRQQHPERSLPMIVLTADTTPTARVAALSTHIEAFLTKPVSPEVLLAAIEQYGVKRRSGKFYDQAGTHEMLTLPDKPVTSVDPGVLRLDKLEQLRQGKTPGIIARLANTYLNDAQRYLKQIETALEGREWDSLKSAAHGLRSAAGAIGAEPLMDLCARIEQALTEPQEQELHWLLSRLPAVAIATSNALTSYLHQSKSRPQ